MPSKNVCFGWCWINFFEPPCCILVRILFDLAWQYKWKWCWGRGIFINKGGEGQVSLVVLHCLVGSNTTVWCKDCILLLLLVYRWTNTRLLSWLLPTDIRQIISLFCYSYANISLKKHCEKNIPLKSSIMRMRRFIFKFKNVKRKFWVIFNAYYLNILL